MTRWPTLRGIILFFAGLAGEVVLTVAWLKGTDPNQALMLLFATMMGLPVFLQKDERSAGQLTDPPLGEPPPQEPPDSRGPGRSRSGKRRDEERTW